MNIFEAVSLALTFCLLRRKVAPRSQPAPENNLDNFSAGA